MAETSTETPAQMRTRAADLHRQADLLPVWESRKLRAESALLRSTARELVALAAHLESTPAPAARLGLGFGLTCTREIGA